MNKKHNRFRSNMSREQFDQLQGTEIKSKRTRFGKVFALGANRFQAVTYTDPVHRFNEKTHEWDELDNRFSATTRMKTAKAAWQQGLMPVVSHGEPLLECKTGSMDVSCAMSGEAPFINLTDAEGRHLAWGIKDAMSILPEADDIDDAPAQNVRGMREKVLNHLHGEVTYNGIFAGVDLRCKLDRSFKDELIFAEKESIRPITFLLESEGRSMMLAADGTLCVMAESGNPIFRLAAPFLEDAEANRGEVAVTLEECANGVFALTYTPDAAFADAAVYPLVLDPEVQTEQDGLSIVDTYVKEGSTANNSANTRIWISHNGYHGKQRGYMRVENLPPIAANDFITGAYLHIKHNGMPPNDTPVMCSEVLGPWDPATITYDTQPEIQSYYQDYCTYPKEKYTWQVLDVTSLARKWYLGENYGVVLTYCPTNNVFAQLCSSDSTSKPYFVVNYASLAGLESYLTYDQQSAGIGGSGSVSLVNGNLIFAHQDTAMDGNRMPVSITHYYNSCDADKDDYGLGLGWRTSLHQTLHKEYMNEEIMYVYTDGDGTEHWFELDEEADDVQYKDLSGLELTLTETAAEDGSIQDVTITSKGDARMVFPVISSAPTADAPVTAKVLIQSLHDAVGNQITVTPRNDNPLLVASVQDGAGRVTTFVYAAQSDNSLKCIAIRTPWQTNANCTRFAYTDGCLTEITHEDNRVSRYTYENRNGFRLLTRITGDDGMAVLYEYTNTGAVYGLPHCIRHAEAGEAAILSDDETARANALLAASVTYAYGNHLTLVKDEISGKTLRYHFNDNGNQISIDDGLGYAVYTEYDQSGENENAPINHATTRSRMQRVVRNLLLDHSFEGDGSAWEKVGDAEFLRNTATLQWGLTSQKIDLNSGEAVVRQTVTLKPGASYTYSGYGKSAAPNGVMRITYTVNGVSKVVESDPFPVVADAAAADFVRQAFTFDLPQEADADVECAVVANGASGACWFDCLQLEEGLTCNHYNMIQNGDFIHKDSDGMPTAWTVDAEDINFVSCIDLSPESEGPGAVPDHLRESDAARVTGRYNQVIRVYQDIRCSGNAGDRFSVGSWCRSYAKKADLAVDAMIYCRLKVEFYYGNPNTSTLTPYTGGTVYFNAGEADWQFGAASVTAPIPYTYIRISLQMRSQMNHADFTGLYLYPESFGTNYVYDAKGNRTKSIRLYGGVKKTDYDDHDNVIQHTEPGHTKCSTFSYGETEEEQKKHLLLESNSPLGTKGTYAYDDFGNAIRSDTSCKASSANSRPALITRSATTYQHNGNYVHQQTDARGKTVTTVVDADKGVTTRVTDPKGQSVDYEHDALRRVVKVTTTDGAREFRNEYTYDATRGLLTGVKHNTDAAAANDVSYTFEYDALGRKTKVKVGSATLSANVYQNDPDEPNYGTLSQMTYGNGTAVKNEYDDFNRVTGVTYDAETTPRYEYAYNANGQVAHVKNNLLQQVAESEYDLSNRPCRIKVNRVTPGADGLPVREHIYTGEVSYDNIFGRLSNFDEQVGAAKTAYKTTFGYDEENRPTALGYGDHGESTLEYDGLGRVAKATVKAGSGTANTTTYTYVAGAALEDVTDKTSTTGLVESISQTGGNFTYTYDDNGNIVSVVQDGVTTSYTYDALGQLIRVDDEQENATWVYEYDQGGNILSKKKYALGVTTGEPVESKTFTYGNANWRDQLTAVNGVGITYDAIGNPLNDGTWQYEWVNGRQLSRMYKVDKDVSFVYNENGLRVQKTVNNVVTKYTLHGKNIVHMKAGNDELHFFYDAQNKPAVVVFNGTPYSYVKNLQGDIVAILDSNKNVVVSYVYDAWGRPISCSGTMANMLGKTNPFRYRGYVYDEETGLYYLRNRYFNATICRFFNEDVLVGNMNLLSTNMYSYCLNKPIVFVDHTGTMATSAHFAMCLFDGNSGGGIDVEDDKYYEFVIIRAISCILRDEDENSIGTVYANAKGSGERLRYIGKCTANETKLMINSEYGEGTVDIAYCFPIREVHYSYYTFSAFDLGAEDCYADWPIINAQNALVEWRASVADPSIPQYTADDVDGSYGPTTRAVMKAFQKSRGLSHDGYLGEKTKPELIKYFPFEWKNYAP